MAVPGGKFGATSLPNVCGAPLTDARMIQMRPREIKKYPKQCNAQQFVERQDLWDNVLPSL